MTNSETRNPNEAQSQNAEAATTTSGRCVRAAWPRRQSLRHSGLIRISGFGIRIYSRGTAEIELLIVCIILLSLLLITAGMLRIGGARLAAVQDASFQAMHDATEAGNPQFADNATPQPIGGIGDIRPALPNRVHTTHPIIPVRGLTGGEGGTFRTRAGAKAAAISPTWAFSGYPVGANDRGMLEAWFEEYVFEPPNIDASIRSSLGLAEPWQP
jgi:hypothetical protein